VAIAGVVRSRPQGIAKAAMMERRDVEIEAQSCEILSEANTPPFIVDDERFRNPALIISLFGFA